MCDDFLDRMSKIVVTFPYNGEPVVELYLEYLGDIVDEFVIVEARHTFSGIKKPELYIEQFKAVFDEHVAKKAKINDGKGKVKLLVIDEFPEMPHDWPERKGQAYMTPESYPSWFRENYQRDYAMTYIKEAYKDQRFILIGVDADEIPRKEFVKELAKNYYAFNNPVFMQLNMFYYNFHWIKKYHWYHPYIVNEIGAHKYTLSDMRTRMAKTQFLPDAGWHASYFLTKKDLIRKIEGFAHRECDISHRKTNAFLDECLYQGRDISERGTGEDLIPYDVQKLPKELQDFHRKIQFIQRYSIL